MKSQRNFAARRGFLAMVMHPEMGMATLIHTRRARNGKPGSTTLGRLSGGPQNGYSPGLEGKLGCHVTIPDRPAQCYVVGICPVGGRAGACTGVGAARAGDRPHASAAARPRRHARARTVTLEHLQP